jgi:tryptophan 2,3-dioxygenase
MADRAAPAATPARSFGEEGARLTYASYLRVDELLSQQVLESQPPAHDELLFITVHQVYELWFQQVLHELTEVRDAMADGRLWWARHLLHRVVTIEHVLITQLAVLETMTPQDFLEFREKLAPASGFQSVQFREIEFLSGAKDPAFLERFRGLTDADRRRLEARLAEPTLWDAFLLVLERAGLAVGDEDETRRSLVTVARDRATYGEVWELAERLVDHDENSASGARAPRDDGRAADRYQVGHRRLLRGAVPAPAAGPALLPAALGAALVPLSNRRCAPGPDDKEDRHGVTLGRGQPSTPAAEPARPPPRRSDHSGRVR